MLPGNGPPSTTRAIVKYLKRALNYKQMDLEFAMWMLFYLPFSPSRVYRTTEYRQQTKGSWARDDPAMLVILAVFIVVSSTAYACALFEPSLSLIHVILYTFAVDLVFTGITIASLGYWASNRFLKSTPVSHDNVEWLYCFDIHCNAWFVMFLYIYVAQYVFLPLLVENGFFSVLVSILFYAAGCSSYVYITYLGYSIVPSLGNTRVFLYPLVLVAVSSLFCIIFRLSPSILVLNWRYAGYF